MKKKWTPVFVIAGIVLLLFGGAVGIQLVQRYMPSKNQADIGELLGKAEDFVPRQGTKKAMSVDHRNS